MIARPSTRPATDRDPEPWNDPIRWIACEHPERPNDGHRSWHLRWLAPIHDRDRPPCGCLVAAEAALAHGEITQNFYDFLIGKDQP